MYWKLATVAVTILPLVMSGIIQPEAAAGTLETFVQRAGQFHSVISLPRFEASTNEIQQSVRDTITAGNSALDRLAALNPGKANFKNTILALDDIGYQISLTDNRLQVIKETSTNAALRDTATDALKQLEEASR